MHHEITLLDVVFRLSLFGLLIYKFISLARNYVIPFLYQQIAEEMRHNDELVEKDKLLVSTRHRLENQIFNQRQRFILLEKNMQIWHRFHVEKNAEIVQENKAIVESIKEKRLLQKRYLSLNNNLKLTSYDALNQARCDLERQADAQEGRILFEGFIDTISSPSTHKMKM